jgi:hypothetical protein
VFGQVQVSATNKEPHLSETPERNPKNLGLNLTIKTSSGEGADVMVWKGVSFHKEVKANEFDNVIVRWDVGQIANFPIVDDRENAAHADAAMKALNAKYPVKGKAAKPAAAKPAAAKPAAEKPAAKKAAPKKAKKAAKKKSAAKKKPRSVGAYKGKMAKKAKKAPKRVAKKPAKKSAKKSAAKKKRR